MDVGGDYHSVAGGDITSKQNLEYNLRHGVKHFTAQVRKRPQGGWDPDELMRMKDDCDRYDVVFEAIRLDSDYIKLRKGPARDREIDTIVGNIRKGSTGRREDRYVSLGGNPVSPEREDPSTRRRCLRFFQAGKRLEESAHWRRRPSNPRGLLGAHNLLPGEDHSCGQRK